MGTTVHLHYCMGEYVDASLIQKEEHTCSKCGMVKTKKDNGCCKDEHKTFKAGEHQQGKLTIDLPQYTIAAVLPALYMAYTEAPYEAMRAKVALTANAPPGKPGTCPIYITIRNFRI